MEKPATSTEGKLPNGGLVGESPKKKLIIVLSAFSAGSGIIICFIICPDDLCFFPKSFLRVPGAEMARPNATVRLLQGEVLEGSSSGCWKGNFMHKVISQSNFP